MTSSQRRTARARIARGIALLNRLDRGWRKKIDLSTLALESPYLCVLGQVSGRFFDGLREFAKRGLAKRNFSVRLGKKDFDSEDTQIDPVYYGFLAPPSSQNLAYYSALTLL